MLNLKLEDISKNYGKLVSGYLWKNEWEGKKSMQTLKKFYLIRNINVDYDGDIENYTKVGEEIGVVCKK